MIGELGWCEKCSLTGLVYDQYCGLFEGLIFGQVAA